jgi:hypothetical protein
LDIVGNVSDWSAVQTITVPNFSASTSASPSPTPTVPEFSALVILPLFAVLILLSTVFIRKKIPKKNITFLFNLEHLAYFYAKQI